MKRIASTIFTLGLLLILGGLCMQYKTRIVEFYNVFLSPKDNVKIESKNAYYRNYDFNFVKNTEYFYPSDYQDILNIYYTVLNAGLDEFSFYCPKSYETCIEDIKRLANDQDTLSDINNYVHPYNGFSHIETEYDSIGRVKISITHNYTEEQINEINEKINELYDELYNDNLTDIDNIKRFHDYIVNNAQYDIEKSKTNESVYHSDIAYGPLFEGYAVCGGYTDLMQLFLEKMALKCFKVSSAKHIWNAVNYEGTWYNIDLTWDDPVANDGNNYLEYHYFMIDTEKLHDLEKTEHFFNESHYSELTKKES